MCADYVLDSTEECGRLERQAVLDGLNSDAKCNPRRH
jgi:hypothetical protein